MNIRAAAPSEVEVLDQIAFIAKAHWGYRDTQMSAWASELLTSKESISSNPTFVAELDGTVVGFAQLDYSGDSMNLVSLFVLPQHMGKGAGRSLLQEAVKATAKSGSSVLYIDSDPNAELFYLACGATLVARVPAPIEGEPNRTRPQFRLSTITT